MEHMKNKSFFFCFLLICLAKVCTSSPSPPPPNYPKNQTQTSPSGKKHFVLIHGAGLGAWSWYKVATLLKDSGHNVTALDLGAAGINPIQIQQLRSISQYVEPLTKLMVSLPPNERIILVGHSIGGAVISIFLERFPEKIAAAVYVTAYMSGPTLKYSTILTEVMSSQAHTKVAASKTIVLIKDWTLWTLYDNGTNNPPTSYLRGPKFVALKYLQLSPAQDKTLVSSLIRFQPLFNYDVIKLTKEKYGSVRRVFIVCGQDQTIVLDVQNYIIRNNPPDEVKVISDSDHFVMISRPLKLFFNLQNIAEKYS
ncbi:salicylic acid-binding protein 2 [Prunus yedoensis var. nudiflora]|uniref:Salicylic acid-binding protein 2 n=1 Tax=Prunus yedoensis var. nudiflora TaxID=2094558 RepID=A0A314UHR9_PRUYE|nr:salicylic acid-binding protein 2 [Prunus yedoensis var. nudiflora]